VIDRRDLLFLLGAAALAPRMAIAQTKQPVLIGWLNVGSRDSHGHFHAVFKEWLAALGWQEGARYVMEERWAGGRMEQLPALAGELANMRPALLLAATGSAARAAVKAAPGIPIVFVVGDPVGTGLVTSLARPGGMATGLANLTTAISEKYVELLLSAAPKLRRIGILVDASASNHALHRANLSRSLAQHSLVAHYAETAHTDEIEPALSRLAKEGIEGLVVTPGQMLLVSRRRRIATFALARSWPVIGELREFAEDGALLSYGVDHSASYRRAAYYVDRILKGAKPGDLPIEQPTKFELVVNMKTAKTLGLTLPQPFLMRADRVIE
jgi:ABC-type uncharacterized transport system substrate-binding protein